MSYEQETKGWLKTFPGILSAIAAILTAIAGLIVALNQAGILGGEEKSPPRVSQSLPDEKTQLALEQPSDSQQSDMGITQKKGEPIVVNKGRYRNTGTKLFRYDFDAPMQLSEKTSDVDFFFKPNSSEPNTKIGVVPYNGAKFAPRSLDLFPWEVTESDFTTARGIYSVPQGKKIPCVTSNEKFCVFSLEIEENSKLTVTFILYELR